MQTLSKHIVIIAGEESGDIHAAELMRKLKKQQPLLTFSGIGGNHLQQEGMHLVSDLARYGVTGVTEVLRHFFIIKKAMNLIQNHLRESKPDLLILVDYPGFNLRLARFAKEKLNIKILYYISPQIWAWKPKRINIIRRYVDHMAVILPFEKRIYTNQIPVSFVGHPLVEKIPTFDDIPALKKSLDLPENKRIIAFLPGSRINEIQRHMPVLVKTAQKLQKVIPDIHFVIPIASSIKTSTIHSFCKEILNISLINGKALEVASCSDCIIVASGTASLECALLKKPMGIIYKVSLLTYILAMKLIRVKYLGLCNLLQNKMTVPELLQYDCNPEELAILVKNLLEDKAYQDKMINELNRLKNNLSNQEADIALNDLVLQLIS